MTKKITISLLVLVLSLSMLIGLVACNNEEEPLLPFKLKEGADDSVARMTGDKTAKELSANPDRGFTIDLYITLDDISSNYGNTYAFPTACKHEGHTNEGVSVTTETFMKNELAKYAAYNPRVVTLTVFLTNYMDKDISSYALDEMNSMIRAIRDKDMSVVLKFAYQHGSEPVYPSIDTLSTHTKTLGKRIAGSSASVIKHTINAFKLSFIGEDGNFYNDGHYSKQDINKIVNLFVDMLPKGSNYYSEVPSVDVKNSASEYSKLLHMGFYNDNFDTTPNQYTSGGMTYGNDDYKQYVYQSNINFNSASIMANKSEIDGKAVLKQMKNGFFSTMDLTRLTAGKSPLVEVWQSTFITKKDLNSYGLPYYDEWFLNSDGTSQNRSVFDYLRDFLGYNLSVTNLKFNKFYKNITENGVSKNKLCTEISFTLTNYGMAAPLFVDRFELTIKNNATGVSIQGGDRLTFPTTYDRQLLVSGGQINFTQLVVGDIDQAEGVALDQKKLGHSIGIRLYHDRSPRDQYVRLSNDVPFDGKVNWIYSTTTKK